VGENNKKEYGFEESEWVKIIRRDMILRRVSGWSEWVKIRRQT
jgi:hypothetical protein